MVFNYIFATRRSSFFNSLEKTNKFQAGYIDIDNLDNLSQPQFDKLDKRRSILLFLQLSGKCNKRGMIKLIIKNWIKTMQSF